MGRYVVSRLVQNLFLLWVLITVVFLMFRIIPGDPVSILVSADLPREVQENLRETWGLNRPLLEQYVTYVGKLLTLDFGVSFQHQRPVWDVLAEKVTNTLVLMVPATLLAIVLGVGAGILVAWRRGSVLERLGILVPPLIRGMPVFWLGILLLMAFSYGLGWFPIGGMRSLGAYAENRFWYFASWDFLWHLTLPLLCMTITSLPEPMLIMRQSLLETEGEDYLELVRAKGVGELVVLRHAARNSLLPVMTWAFHMFGYAIASTVVIEMVFSWPGLGREIISALNALDYPMAQAAFFLISAVIIALNFVLDLVYGVLDPRVSV